VTAQTYDVTFKVAGQERVYRVYAYSVGDAAGQAAIKVQYEIGDDVDGDKIKLVDVSPPRETWNTSLADMKLALELAARTPSASRCSAWNGRCASSPMSRAGSCRAKRTGPST
jgi:hypothetical protein